MADFTWLQTLWTYEPDRTKKPQREPLKIDARSTRVAVEPPPKRPGRDHGPSKN